MHKLPGQSVIVKTLDLLSLIVYCVRQRKVCTQSQVTQVAQVAKVAVAGTCSTGTTCTFKVVQYSTSSAST